MLRKTTLDPWIAGKIGLRDGELTREAIADHQLDKLNETSRWARTRSPFYANRLNGLPDGDLGSLADLQHFPFTDAADLRTRGLQFICVSQSEISRVVTLESSGTCGDPKRVFFTREDQELTIDFFRAGMSTLVKPGESVLIALPGERPGSVGDLLAMALTRLGARPVPCGLVANPSAAIALIRREQVDCIVGIPVQILALVRSCGTGVDVPSRHLTKVLLCSDHVPDSVVGEIKRAWDCEVFEHYGMTEMGLGGGVDCDAHSGYHLREADLYVEIVDPETATPVPPGHFGEIVFTTLTRKGMPFIRYRTGDISRLLPGACTCGSVVQRLDRVRGRRSGQVRLAADATITIADLDEILFQIPGLADFTATMVHGHRPALVIRAAGHGEHQNLREAVRNSLGTIPAIRSVAQSGQFDITVKIAEANVSLGTGKRFIRQEVA